MANLDNILKSRDINLSTKVRLVKAIVYPVVMYGCKSWTIKKDEHWRTDAFELWCWRRLASLLDCKIQPVHSKGDRSWVFFGRTNAKAETLILWPPHEKRWLIGKDSDAGMPPIPIHFSTGFWLFPWHLYPNIPLPLGVCPQQSSPCVSHQHKSLTSLPPSLASCFSQ